jgi:hypothetical protein
VLTRCVRRVKLPKTFLAVNLSYAFTFQEKQHQTDNEGLEMKPVEHGKGLEHEGSGEPVAAAAGVADGDVDANVVAETLTDTVVTTETSESEIATEAASSEEPPTPEIATETVTVEDKANPVKPEIATDTATVTLEDQTKPEIHRDCHGRGPGEAGRGSE